MTSVFKHVRMGSLTPKLPEVFGEGDYNGKNGKSVMQSSRMFWGGLGQMASAGQVVFGVLVLLASQMYLVHSGRSTGQFVGVGSLLMGGAGWMGNRKQKPQLQALFVFGMGFLGLITFEFIGQVGRDLEIHCNFAESYARISHLEEKVTSLKHDEMVNTLFTRMNEMDDLLDMVQSGAIDKLELRHKQQDLAGQDINYVQGKINALHHHADQVLESIHAKAKKLDEAGHGDPDLIATQKEMRRNLETHIDNVEAVMKHLRTAEEKQRPLTYEEYEMLFNALMAGHSDSEVLKAEEKHLPWIKAAWERQSANEYHKYDLNQNKQNIQEADEQRRAQREKFEEQFMTVLKDHPRMNKHDYERSMVSTLESLPQYCMTEMGHLRYIRFGCWMLILSQLAASYISVTSMMIWTQKKDS